MINHPEPVSMAPIEFCSSSREGMRPNLLQRHQVKLLLSLIRSCLIEIWVLEAVAGKYGNNDTDLLNCSLRAA